MNGTIELSTELSGLCEGYISLAPGIKVEFFCAQYPCEEETLRCYGLSMPLAVSDDIDVRIK